MRERRNDNRMLCAELVELIYRETSGKERRRIVNLDDISRLGACVQLDTYIAVDTKLRLRCKGDELAGIVRYCGFRDGGYFVGIEFTGKCQWLRSSFVPEHLLDPRSLSDSPDGAWDARSPGSASWHRDC